MADEEETERAAGGGMRRAGLNIGGFLAGAVMGWLLFDSLIFALLFGLILGAASETAQRAGDKRG